MRSLILISLIVMSSSVFSYSLNCKAIIQENYPIGEFHYYNMERSKFSENMYTSHIQNYGFYADDRTGQYSLELMIERGSRRLLEATAQKTDAYGRKSSASILLDDNTRLGIECIQWE